ncbi:SidA/IucD/PvdA family monooxygenase [Streptomyces sp. RKND-216]|uniref:lysine N(6)-hydroxylase/L-ornithine N(5)-oxygenase family protein n=1 Tax=Streptomyces sp. RKND-216 TaxID=2562581 RepID=UPI001445B548|nr:SidA/IucD/PvdA family monooxygenase [Streptomyces sp. RKND-216]
MESFDLVGIGVGPSNLSLAALAEPVEGLRAGFLESKPRFRWHPGLMLPDAWLQVSYLKDLVTLVDPTSRFSFLNFLSEQGRIFRALVANGMSCSRQEFEQYYQWAAEGLPDIHWQSRVKSVSVVGDRFEVVCDSGLTATARSLVLGSGREPYLPPFAAAFHGSRVLHGSELLSVRPDLAGRRVMVVGAGQSGAEVVNYLLSEDAATPAELTWVSSRVGFLPIDDSPFSNEWFAPSYVDYFHSLPAGRRADLLGRQRLASDGVSESLLRKIYQRLYRLDHLEGGTLSHRLLPCRRVTDLRGHADGVEVSVLDTDRDVRETVPADVVVFCTGYRSRFPDYLEPLREALTGDGGAFRVRRDYSLDWDGPPGLRVFVQNFAEDSHGIADPNLSLSAWRSARIVNAAVGREVYRTDGASTATAWSSA